MRVMAMKCSECLFSSGKIVSDARRDRLVRDLVKRDVHFFCHKSTIVGQEVVCRGSFDMAPQMVRIARRLGVVEYVEESALSEARKEW